jgi:hypothetical protein
MKATSATSFGEFIAIPPIAVSLSRAAGVGSNPTTESPDLIMFLAIADPMMPIPMISTGSLTSDSPFVITIVVGHFAEPISQRQQVRPQ